MTSRIKEIRKRDARIQRIMYGVAFITPLLAWAVPYLCVNYTIVPRVEREAQHTQIRGAIPVEGDAREPLYILDRDGDGRADIIMTYPRQALYIAPDHQENIGLVVDENTKTLDGELRDAATRVMKADQELSALLSIN